MSVVEEGYPSHFFPKIVLKRRSNKNPSQNPSQNPSSTNQNHSNTPNPNLNNRIDQNDLEPHLRGDDNANMVEDNIQDVNWQNENELAETIQQVRKMGFGVDDDNDALPENVPTEEEKQARKDGEDALHELGQEWGCNGIDERAKTGVDNSKPKINHGMDQIGWEKITYLQMFLLFFPLHLRNVVIDATNKNLKKNGQKEISHGEFPCWLGIWLFMSTLSGFARTEYWANFDVCMGKGAPYRFHHWMSGCRFKAINTNLFFTLRDAPSDKDCLWSVREM